MLSVTKKECWLNFFSCCHCIFHCKTFASDYPQACPAWLSLTSFEVKSNGASKRAAEYTQLTLQTLTLGTHLLQLIKAISRLNDPSCPCLQTFTADFQPERIIKYVATSLDILGVQCICWYLSAIFKL